MNENVNTKSKNELNKLPRVFIKAVIVVVIALIPIFLMNFAMQSFLDEEVSIVRAAAEKAEKARQALLESAGDMDQERLETELAILKAEQYEEFYQKYKYRESYHYYGQFYEMFENMYDANVLFLGTSHAAHGVNPLYVEEGSPDWSFFNFALNGSNPQYYLDWYDVFKESGYPTPEVIVFCVDWFMCDDGWLWRRLSFDDTPDKPIDIMRKIKNSRKSVSAKAPTETTSEAETITAVAEEPVQAEKINFWDVDAILSNLFNKLPMIYSRDRIPEMIRYYLGSSKIEDPEIIDPAETPAEITEEKLPEIPVYKHEYLKDGAGNITSDYYKGFIPWENSYGGDQVNQGCNDTEEQWNALTKLLDRITADGIKLIFVEAPEYLNGRRARQAEPNNARLAELAVKYNAQFLNYNEELKSEINDEVTNFSDWGHMNTKGSTAFSKLLGKDLKPILESLKNN